MALRFLSENVRWTKKQPTSSENPAILVGLIAKIIKPSEKKKALKRNLHLDVIVRSLKTKLSQQKISFTFNEMLGGGRGGTLKTDSFSCFLFSRSWRDRKKETIKRCFCVWLSEFRMLLRPLCRPCSFRQRGNERRREEKWKTHESSWSHHFNYVEVWVYVLCRKLFLWKFTFYILMIFRGETLLLLWSKNTLKFTHL